MTVLHALKQSHCFVAFCNGVP